jgi:hypothetical protein
MEENTRTYNIKVNKMLEDNATTNIKTGKEE